MTSRHNKISAQTNRNHRIQLVAGLLTLLLAALIVAILFVGGISWEETQEGKQPKPEIAMLETDDETFIEPELVTDPGVQDATEPGEPAPQVNGEPEPADKPNDRVVVSGKNEQKTPAVEKPITQKQPSTVKATEPTKNDKPDQKIQGKTKFNTGKNGDPNGKPGATGSGGQGSANAHGSMKGRSLISCPKFTPNLSKTEKVVLRVTVTEEGSVRKASFKQRCSITAVNEQCLQAALKSRWTPKKGAGDKEGTLTFTLTPKK